MSSRNDQLFEQSRKVIPGGVNSPVRAFRSVGGTPRFFTKGQGSRVWDADGKSYLDYVGSWGPLILGHADADVVRAVQDAATLGLSFGAPTEMELVMAEKLVAMLPSIEMVRLVSSGTEATMSAIRLARGHTGRDTLVKFEGCYHGHADSLLVKAGSGLLTFGQPSSAGVPADCSGHTLVLDYNDIDQVNQLFAEKGDEIACVIVEAVAGNMNLIKPKSGFLEALRENCTKHGAVLIFDEVMTGFRVAYGGAQAVFGMKPDLTTLGKVIGGGLPVGAYGGRADIMDHVLPAGRVFQAGTLSGNPLATAAGIATLKVLRDTNPYPRLEQLSTRLAIGLEQAAKAAGIPVSIGWFQAMMTLFFSTETIVDWNTASRCNTKAYARYFWGLLERGVYMPCSQFEALFLSTAHTEDDIDATIRAAAEAFDEVAEPGA
jgi:glutamate-1-semialdehyde 2,1-aminomutase